MHDKKKFEDLKCLKERFVQIVFAQLDCGIEKVDTHELGEVVDMIKDLAHAEKNCMETEYYMQVCEAMNMYKDDPEVLMHLSNIMGYNPNRSVTGRYDSRGGDHTVPGWRSGYPMDDRNKKVRAEDDTKYPSGYPYYPIDGGVDPNMAPYMNDTRHGKPYNDYKMWKRNYTTSKSQADKNEMDKHAIEHVEDTIETMREIWKESDPELKRKMKTDMSKLLSEMN